MANYIFFDGRLQKRAGGPSTYLYNLLNGLKKENSKSIEFIYNQDELENSTKNFYDKIKKILSKFPYIYERVFIYKQKRTGKIYEELSKIKDGDNIMFHMTSDFAKAYNFLPKGCTKILMSHSPEIASNQIVNDSKAITKNEKYKFNYLRKIYFEEFDFFAFKNADIIVFPSKDAMEPYYETCENFEEIIKDKKLKFISTGTEVLEYNTSREEIRKKYNIPTNAFVITFVGRHNLVKGYDNFIKICEKALEKYDDIYIITAGIGNLESPKNRRWIDVGWTNDPGSIVNAADVFILPNRRTYFDLVLLEMLSIGKTCIVSNTGGNKTIAKCTDGVILYNDIEDAVKEIYELHDNRELLEKYSKCNIATYKENFTPEVFTNNYIKLMEEIENEKKY